MSNTTVRDLFRSLEQTLLERLRFTEDVIRSTMNASVAEASKPKETVDSADAVKMALDAVAERDKVWEQRVQMLEQKVSSLVEETVKLRRAAKSAVELLPAHPLEGIEVIPKREVVVPIEPEPISAVDRLIMNRRALKALEAEEMGETRVEDHPEMEGGAGAADDTEEEAVEEEAVEEEAVEEEVVEEEAVEEEVVEEEVVEEEAVEEEAVEEEAVEEEAEEEAAEEEAVEEEAEEEAVELEEFEYKGATYFRDGENNVYMADEDGELIEEPIGTWNEAKQRIILPKKPAA